MAAAAGGAISDTAAEITLPLWEQIRAQQTVLNDVFAWGRSDFLMGAGADAVARSRAVLQWRCVSPRCARRRLMAACCSPADDQPGCDGAVVLSHAFWQSRFGGDRSVLGTSITLLQQRFPIVGVAPPDFTGLEVGRSFDVALPICAASRIGPSYRAA